MRIGVLILFLILPGLAVMIICGHYLLADWQALQIAQARFEHLAAQPAELTQLFIADAKVATHRTNVFAEGVWLLLGALWAGLGVHGLCLPVRPK
jgi:hypothetical protein